MRTILFFFSVLVSTATFGQTDTSFHVSQGIITEDIRTNIKAWKKSKPTFYEDEKYIVSKTCSGEWGGTIKFKNKKTGIEYACQATCPVSVNKIDDKYYVSSSLAHMRGSCEVLEISQPDSMEMFRINPPREIDGKKVKYVGDDESTSLRGTKKLIRVYGKRILGSFFFDGQLFHVVSDHKETHLATVENEKFKSVKLITNEDFFTYDNEIIKTESGHLIIPIANGYLDIFENQIKILKHR